MEFADEKLFDQAVAFLLACKSQRTHIIHDFDADGISGGLLLKHTLRRLGAHPTTSFKVGRGAALYAEELEKLKKQHNPQRIIITDQDPKSYDHYTQFRECFPDVPLLILDHHKVMQYDDALFVHPEQVYNIRGDKYCSAKLIYDVCDAATDTEDLSWLAATGILGDANARYFPAFLTEVCTYHDIPIPDDWFAAPFAQITETIDCCSAVSEEELTAYVEKLSEQETLEGALHIGNPCIFVKEEVERYVRLGKELAQEDGPVTWMQIESEHNISSWVTTIISFSYPHKVFVGYREQVDDVALNFRYQEAKIHVGELARQIATPLGGRGGGHAPAGGGVVPKEKFAAFRKQFDAAVQQALTDKKKNSS